MVQLWTDLITPQELTGVARGAMDLYQRGEGEEARGETLSRFLPNQNVFDISVRFTVGQGELVEEARWRSYDAEVEFADGEARGRRVTVDLPAVGQARRVTEYTQLRSRNVQDEVIRTLLEDKAAAVGRAVEDSLDRVRGHVLRTGAAVVEQSRDNGNPFYANDDFQRDSSLSVELDNPFADTDTSVMEQFSEYDEAYRDINGVGAAYQLMSSRAFRALRAHPEFAHLRPDGSLRNASAIEAIAQLEGEGLPVPVLSDRRTKSGRVIPEDVVIWLPSDGQAGSTYWGETETSRDSSFGIVGGDTPGLVVGAYRNPKPPMGVEVISDAIAWPVLTNPNSTMAISGAVA